MQILLFVFSFQDNCWLSANKALIMQECLQSSGQIHQKNIDNYFKNTCDTSMALNSSLPNYKLVLQVTTGFDSKESHGEYCRSTPQTHGFVSTP